MMPSARQSFSPARERIAPRSAPAPRQQSFVIAAARARNAHNPAPLAAQSQYPTKPLSMVLAEYAVVITAVTVGAGLLLGF